MTTISMIAAMAKNRTIGVNGRLPWHLKKDLQYFKQQTLGKPMVMGRKTFQSFGERPLPKRPHIVITRDLNYNPEDVTVCHSLKEALEVAATLGDEVMVIGGGQIYKEALPLCDKIYLTEIEMGIEGDTFFPSFNHLNFTETDRTRDCENDISFDYVTYTKQK
ncbi:MAG: dihydrofolate reductase [Pseudomonadota bacterium]|nr:dihydrofolate reductase [Pseudomonadota bacterium]